MQIKQLQKEYIQKSRLFLYPHLNIPRGASVTPIQTYISWLNHITPNDCKLICVYYLRQDTDFKKFEKRMLLTNQYYENSYKIDDDKIAYVFNFSSFKDDFTKIYNGKYSTLSLGFKKKILEFFNNHPRHHSYILSYLDPTRFIQDYALLLGVDEQILYEVGELCSPPDKDQENLKSKINFCNFDELKLLTKTKTNE